MSQGRRKHTPAFKAKVALEAVRRARRKWPNWPPGTRFILSQIQSWKKALTEWATGVFGNGQDQKARER